MICAYQTSSGHFMHRHSDLHSLGTHPIMLSITLVYSTVTLLRMRTHSMYHSDLRNFHINFDDTIISHSCIIIMHTISYHRYYSTLTVQLFSSCAVSDGGTELFAVLVFSSRLTLPTLARKLQNLLKSPPRIAYTKFIAGSNRSTISANSAHTGFELYQENNHCHNPTSGS